MRKDVITEEIILRVWNNTIGIRYTDAANDELENRREYNDDIKIRKCELRKDFEDYKIQVIKAGINDGSLGIEGNNVLAINKDGEQKIELINKSHEELMEDLENVESSVYIEEEFECDLNADCRANYVDMIENLLWFTDAKPEELRKEYLENLALEISELNDNEKQIAIRVGELLMTSVLDNRSLNEYDSRVDNLFSELT